MDFHSTNPATGDVVWSGQATSSPDGAIASARASLIHWRDESQREATVLRFAEALKGQRTELASAICRETGKPRWEANTEVDAMIGKVAISIEARRQRRGTSAEKQAEITAAVRYKPHGVAVVLGPFNFPGHLPNGHIVPALLAGNAVVFKPSEMTPLVGEITARCWEAAGLPSGVFNLVQGGRELGEALVNHPGVDAVYFTGSLNGGRAINRALVDRPGVIAALEMGGNNPLIVHDVADLDAAAYWTIQSAYITAGQRCSCARRLIVINNDAFIDRLVRMISRIHIGAYTDDPEPFAGPVISDPAATRLLDAQDKLLKKGAKSIVRMEQVAGARLAMLRPGLIDVTNVRERDDEELFGPLLQLIRVDDLEAAIAEANNTRYGLAAGLFSDDRKSYERFYSAIRAGVVNWNRPLTGASSKLPFGGVGNSGNGRPSASFAADYCDYPVASLEVDKLTMPAKLTPGISSKPEVNDLRSVPTGSR